MAIRTTWGRQFDRTLATDPSIRYRCTLVDNTLARPYELLKSDRLFTRAEPFPPDELPWAIEYWVLAHPNDPTLRHAASVYHARRPHAA